MSRQYLAHHGILGMHWGIRRYQNPDGTLTEAGKKRYYKTALESTQDVGYRFKNGSSNYTSYDDAFSKKGLHKLNLSSKAEELSRSKRDLENSEKDIAELLADYDKERSKYSFEAAIASALAQGEHAGGDVDMSTVAEYYIEYDHGDLDQGYITSIGAYLRTTNKIDAAKKAVSKREAAEKDYKSAIESAAKTVLGEYADKKVNNFATLGQEIADRELGKLEMSDPIYRKSYSYALRESLDGLVGTDGYNASKYYDEAAKYISKLPSITKNPYQFEYLIDRAGLADTPIISMTDADWKALERNN